MSCISPQQSCGCIFLNSPSQTGKGDRFAVDRVDYHERSEVLRFSSVEDWFKSVDLAPKEKVPAEPGNEMKFPACKAAVWFSLFYGFPPFPCFMVFHRTKFGFIFLYLPPCYSIPNPL